MGRTGRDPSSQSFPSFLIHSSLSSCHSGNCFLICLPVDVLIIYKEPFGMEATMVIIVLAFVPFLVIIVYERSNLPIQFPSNCFRAYLKPLNKVKSANNTNPNFLYKPCSLYIINYYISLHQSILGDSMYPEKETLVKTKGECLKDSASVL